MSSALLQLQLLQYVIESVTPFNGRLKRAWQAETLLCRIHALQAALKAKSFTL
jgi:hypothetical protein